jgi:putative nucleotidyltransferase with HDIG domain
LDSRDTYTAYHSENVAKYSELIAREMGLSERHCTNIKLAALLHDIGKIGIPENILNKPSRLTDDEFDIIKSHPTIGYTIVKDLKFFKENGVLEAILYHHEREDGSGYPKGLKSAEIHLYAKIIAVADSFDAISSNRIYRDKKSLEYAINEINSKKEKWYASEVVDAFNKMIKREG